MTSPLIHENVSVAYVAERCKGAQVYLATPFTKHESHDAAFKYALLWSARFADSGVTAVSPVALSVPMAAEGIISAGLDDWGFWMDWSNKILAASDAVVVPDITGWRDSKGIAVEINEAVSTNKPVYFVRGQV